MSTASGDQLAVGARKGYIFELDANGYPAAPDTDPYEGIELVGIKAADINIPDFRVISHGGNDINLANDFLPSMEAITGELRAANLGQALNAKVANVKVYSVAEASALAWATDQQGNEIDIAIHVWQQSLDTVEVQRRWRTIIAPKVRAMPYAVGMNENAAEQRIRFVSSPTKRHLWHTALTTGVEGATKMNFEELMTYYHPKFVAWQGDGVADELLFPASFLPIAAGKLKVWDNGVVATPTLAVDRTKITFDDPVVDTHIVVAWYEYA